MKEKLLKKGFTRRLFSAVLALAMVISLLPINSISVYAFENSDECYYCHHTWEEHGEVGWCNKCGDDCYFVVDIPDTSTWPDNKTHAGCMHSSSAHFYATGVTYGDQGSGKVEGRLFGFETEDYYDGSFNGAINVDSFADDISEGWYYQKSSDWKWYKCSAVHSHTWTYGVENTSTLVATCTCNDQTEGYASCVYKDKTGNDRKVSLTLTSSSANYSGSTVPPVSFESTEAWTGAGLSLPEIKYVGRGDTTYTEKTDAPTTAGTYTAKITVDGQTASVEFEIKNHNLTPATSTMIGIELDTPDYEFNEESLNTIFAQNNIQVEKGIYVVFANDDDEYAGAYYGNMGWSDGYTYGLSMWASVAEVFTVYVLGTVQEPHTHSFDYSASGSKLTATSKCHSQDGCAYGGTQKVAELTLSASSANYSGKAATITVGSEAQQTAWKEAFGDTSIPTVHYEGRDGTELPDTTVAPVNTGKYTAKITAGDKTVSVNFEIKDHNLNLVTSATTGIKLDDNGLYFDRKLIKAIFEQNAIQPKANDYVIYALGADPGTYCNARYDGENWDESDAGDLDTIKKKIEENKKLYVIGTVVEPDNKTYADVAYKTTTKKSTVKVPGTYTEGNTVYTFVSLKRNAFNGKYVKKVVLPATIQKIESRAFAGDNKLRSIKINSTKVTVSKSAFKGIKKRNLSKIKVTVSKKMSKKNFKKLKKNLVKQGLRGSKIVRK